MNTAVLHAQGIGIAYAQGRQQHAVLRDFELQVAAGEVVSILGHSGVGKSSLLRILAGLQAPQAGEVSLLGERIHGPHPGVAVAFQEPALLPWRSLAQNVSFGLDFKHQPHLARDERQRRVDEAIAAVGLTHASEQYPAQLSGGMAQRAALARCLARQPRVLLLDEPFGALDEVTRADMQRLLLSIVRARDAAVVLITHDIDEALLLSDRVLLLGGAPASTLGEWPVQLPQPRDAQVEALGALRVDILKTLRRAGRASELSSQPLQDTAHVHGRSDAYAS
jgi:NitT/TauT family transport system ATP-binding protein